MCAKRGANPTGTHQICLKQSGHRAYPQTLHPIRYDAATAFYQAWARLCIGSGMTLSRNHLAWLKLKCPYSLDSEDYKKAYARLHGTIYPDIERLRAEFGAWCEDNHEAVTHHYVNGQWLAVIGSRSKPPTAQNLKAISQHRQKYRVSKRTDGKLFRWSFNTLKEAIAKRDAIFA